MLYLVIAVLLFGLLVAVHELGHFATAKLFGVRVNEFAVGMGPALFSRQWGETRYSLRLFPLGGYCAMEGEDEDSEDPRAFGAKPAWQRVIVLAAGSFMNFLVGLLLILLINSRVSTCSGTQLVGFMDGFELVGEQGLMEGDRIVSIDGERIRLTSDVSLFLSRAGGAPVDVVVERGGRMVSLDQLPLSLKEYEVDGQKRLYYGFYFNEEDATIPVTLRNSWYQALNFLRLVRISLADLVSGRAGIRDLSGPIGVVDTMAQVGAQSQTVTVAISNILYFAALLAVNLAAMNLLPLPALDGGRIFFVAVNALWYLLFRRRIPANFEGYVHLAGLVLLLGLMVVVAYNDIVRIFTR